MADDIPRALICLIEGESSLFQVKVTGSSLILELRKLIKEEALIHAAAHHLTLWKVRTTMASDGTTNSLAG